MSQSNQLVLPDTNYLSMEIIDVATLLKLKYELNEVFMTFTLLNDDGQEWGSDFKARLFMLWQSLNDVIDVIAVNNLNDQKS